MSSVHLKSYLIYRPFIVILLRVSENFPSQTFKSQAGCSVHGFDHYTTHYVISGPLNLVIGQRTSRAEAIS